MIYLAILGVWRIVLFGIAVTAQRFPFVPRFPYSDIYLIPSSLPPWVWGWANFDGVHYLTIAKTGYSAQFTQTFFPLYPIFVRIVSLLIHDKFLILSGILISFIAMALGVHVFYKLLSLDYDRDQIIYILLFLFLFPTSFYFGALYTEALFFFLVITAFWCARTNRWWLSGICGMLASATRITGIFLLPALLWEWLYQKSSTFRRHSLQNDSRKTNSKFQIKVALKSAAGIMWDSLRSPVLYLVPLGLIFYMVFLQWKYGDALLFWHAQSVFGAERASNSFVFPLQVVWRYLKILKAIPFPAYAFWLALGELSAFIVSVGFLISAHLSRVRFSYLVFSWLVIIVPTLTGTFSSLPRYVLMVFPMFISLGLIKNKAIKLLVMAVSVLLLTYLTSLFIRGLWVA